HKERQPYPSGGGLLWPIWTCRRPRRLLEAVVHQIIPGRKLQADLSVLHRVVNFPAATADLEQIGCIDQRDATKPAAGIAVVLLCPLLRAVGFGSSESFHLAPAKFGV